MKRWLPELLNAAFIAVGILSAGMGLKGFLLSSNFIDGGVTGICSAFAVRSVVGIAGLAVALLVVPYPDVTPDLVLTAVFGGFFLGAGIGLAVRGGAVLDGTEIAALLISKRTDVLRVGDVILGFNVVLFVAAMSILGVDAALYSILTYLAAAQTIDFIVNELDPRAFIVFHPLAGVEGGMVKTRRFH